MSQSTNFFANIIEESLMDSGVDAFSSDIGSNIGTRWQKRKKRMQQKDDNNSSNNSKSNYGKSFTLNPHSNSTSITKLKINTANHNISKSENSKQHSTTNSNQKSMCKSKQTNKSESFSDNQYICDRFIPSRNDNNPEKAQIFNMKQTEELKQQDTPNKTFDKCLKTSLLSHSHCNSNNNNIDKNNIDLNINNSNSKNSINLSENNKILTFKDKAPLPSEDFNSHLRALYTVSAASASLSKNNSNKNHLNKRKKIRYISQSAERILDAPDLQDNFYLNLLDWSSKNIIAIGLGQCLYLWNAQTGQANLLFETNDDNFISSVAWTHTGTHIAIGMDDGLVYIWDVKNKKQIRKMRGHGSRVGSLAWNSHTLTSGSKDSLIMNHDVRAKQHHISTFKGHEQEICGLKWDKIIDGTYLASGGNDNFVCIWENKHTQSSSSSSTTSNDNNGIPIIEPKHMLTECKSAVKALAWCPWQHGLLATGGGTGDRNIRFYDAQTGNCINQVDTQSQVCSLQWNPFEKELLSSHGFSKYQLSIWRYPVLQKTHDLIGHTSRILHTAISPDGTMVCSAAADETLRIWKVFEKPPEKTIESQHISNKQSKLNLRIR